MKTKEELNANPVELNDKDLNAVSGGTGLDTTIEGISGVNEKGIIENISQPKPEQASGGLTGQPIFNGDGQRRGTNESPLGNKIETFN